MFARLLVTFALMTPALTCAQAPAQTFPSKPIRLIVPNAPGGAADAFARPTAQKLSEQLGQPVIVDNRPGGNNTLGADITVKSPPDGYTMLMASSNHYIGPFFAKAVPYTPMRDFTPIAMVANVPNMVAVHPSIPVNSIKELVEYAKKQSGPVFYGTVGIGSTHHFGGILLAQLTGVRLEHVAYKGGAPTINDVLAGEIPMAILTASTIMRFTRAGKLRALAAMETKRYAGAPEIPTIAESVPGYEVPDTWFGLLGPAGIPPAIVERLNAEIRKAITAPDVRPRLEGLGFEIVERTPQEFAETVKANTALFAKVVNAAGIKPE